MRIYQDLPEDLQRLIRNFFTVWQRIGMIRPPPVLSPDPDQYYRTIRRAPSRSRWNPLYPSFICFRRQRYLFEWHIRVHSNNRTTDAWIIEMIPQWDPKDKTGLAVNAMHMRPWIQHLPPVAELTDALLMDHNNIIVLELEVKRDNPWVPPTRQCMAEMMVESVIRMADDIENHCKKN